MEPSKGPFNVKLARIYFFYYYHFISSKNCSQSGRSIPAMASAKTFSCAGADGDSCPEALLDVVDDEGNIRSLVSLPSLWGWFWSCIKLFRFGGSFKLSAIVPGWWLNACSWLPLLPMLSPVKAGHPSSYGRPVVVGAGFFGFCVKPPASTTGIPPFFATVDAADGGSSTFFFRTASTFSDDNILSSHCFISSW